MTKPPIISRRLLLAGFWLAGTSPLWAQVRRGNDQGIGGTGLSRGDDHGIGGTGIVGVIQRFGSIFVNGERIGYAPDVPVRINGEAASVKALRIGHVARVVAQRQANGMLTTNRIDAVSEVVGPIESVKGGEMTVLGQKVAWTGRENWRVGTQVAVSGLRRTDGVIVASLVEQRRNAIARVTGPRRPADRRPAARWRRCRARRSTRSGRGTCRSERQAADLARTSRRPLGFVRRHAPVDRSLCAARRRQSAARVGLCGARHVALRAGTGCTRGGECRPRRLAGPAR